jgi:hypothetical protein
VLATLLVTKTVIATEMEIACVIRTGTDLAATDIAITWQIRQVDKIASMAFALPTVLVLAKTIIKAIFAIVTRWTATTTERADRLVIASASTKECSLPKLSAAKIATSC